MTQRIIWNGIYRLKMKYVLMITPSLILALL